MAATTPTANATATATSSPASTNVTRPHTTTTTTAAARTPARPVQTPHIFYNHNSTIRPNPNNTNNPTLHHSSVPSSARPGFTPRQSPPARPPDPLPFFANHHSPGTYHPRAVGVNYWTASVRPHDADFGGGYHMPNHHEYNNRHHHPHVNSVHMMRQHPAHLAHQNQQSFAVGGGLGHSLGLGLAMASPPIKGVPVAGQLKVAPPVPDSNGNKNLRDRSKDDTVITVRNRKVRITEDATLYALCRSWLRNGYPEENQPYYGNDVKSLPRPLPVHQVDTRQPKKEGEEEENEGEEDGEDVDELSSEELLARHIKRAKKVRARFKKEWLNRIARYKTRLALLLPPQVEPFRNDNAAGN